MPFYLLDTNIVSDLIRNPDGVVAKKIKQVGENRIATSIVVASELRFGALKRGSAKLTAQVEAVLGALSILPLEAPTDVYYAQIRFELEAKGKIIGGNDLLIAAHCMALDRVLVTNNVSEFERVDDLAIENWLGL
jgi:tRNA(fMet)-specific endonuclease VapC